MVWTKPAGHSKSKIDMAGEILAKSKNISYEVFDVLDLIDNWRAIHEYPLHIFKKRLKSKARKVDKNAIAVQRLKRLPSIINKLRRTYQGNRPTMNLTQMQDIAGCRAVMSNLDLVNKLYKEGYLKSDIKHKRVNEKNYILNPKPDGYRSIHLIYRFKSDKEGKLAYNGLLVEVQLRTKLQHQWATAVETVDFFTRQAIKSNEGREDWMEFFKLVSSAFAIIEKTPLVHGTPTDKMELHKQIKEMEKQLNVLKVMSGWARAVKVFQFTQKKRDSNQYYLLELDIVGEKLNITGYPQGKEEQAIANYSDAENKNQGREEYDVVLVGVDAFNDLQKAYPNYFADTDEFLKQLRKIVAETE